MFTGIVEEAGTVRSFHEGEQAWALWVDCTTAREDAALGDSIAVNGCCLTVVELDDRGVRFDLLGETVRLTSFDGLTAGSVVNLERSLRFNGKVGGHFVTGHIDALGAVATFEPRGKDVFLRVEVPDAFMRYLVYKGSIAIDGVSLTVAEVDDNGFAVWLIPHTLEVTSFHSFAPGRGVNLEFDILGKYVERLLPGNRALETSADT